MTAVAFVSAKGSPGVTTTALLLAAVWPGGALLLEADPAGGDLRAQFSDPISQPLRADRGVVSLLTAQPLARAASVDGANELLEHSQKLPGGLPVVLGPSNASQVEALRPQWTELTHAVARSLRCGSTVVVDAGRLGDPSSLSLTLPLLRTCATTVVVARTTVTSLSHARDLLGLLAQVDVPTELLLIGDARDTVDVPQSLGIATHHVHCLPDDPDSAMALSGPWTRRLDRSRLLIAARRTASSLHAALAVASAGPPLDRLIDLTRGGAVPA